MLKCFAMPCKGVEGLPRNGKPDETAASDLYKKWERFLPVPPGATEEEIDRMCAYLDAILDLSDKCFYRFLGVHGKLLDRLGRLPTNQEILQSLDDGHAAWFVMWETEKKSRRDINRLFQRKHEWYQQWKTWFKDRYPSYFSESEE